MEPCPDCEEFRTIVDPVPKHVHWCHERIAELEAEVEWARLGWDSEKARAEKAQAEVERLRKEHLGMSDEDLRALREKGAV